jgi:hypothetical protein
MLGFEPHQTAAALFGRGYRPAAREDGQDGQFARMGHNVCEGMMRSLRFCFLLPAILLIAAYIGTLAK